MKTVFQTGPCRFAVDSDIEIRWEHDFRKFIILDGTESCPVYTVRAVPELPPPRGERILNRPDVEVWLHEGQEIRYYRLNKNPCFLPCGKETRSAIGRRSEICWRTIVYCFRCWDLSR